MGHTYRESRLLEGNTMPGEHHDIPSLPELAATVMQHTTQIADLDGRVVKIESGTSDIEKHLAEQDKILHLI